MRGPVASFGQHEVGAVKLVAGGAETSPDRAGICFASEVVAQQPRGLGVVVVVSGTGVAAELVLEVALNGAGVDEAG
jgi:hypothetical protein